MERVVSKVMVILELLGDGKWHRIEELLLRAGLSEQKFQEITGFLSKYGFVKVDEENKKVKVNRDFRRLLVQPVT
jgi:DNA-binding IclR family transcriptional regulator